MESTSTPRSIRSALVESRGAVLVSLVLLAIGLVLRLHLYADRRSLWLDEIWVALNIVERDFLGLARPLDYAQSAPVGFLWLERLAVVLGGVNELALRAVPFLAGCLLLVALWMLARRLLDARYAALCLAFAALSPILIYFSNEVKPYIVDALAAVVLTWLTLDVLEAPDSPRAWRRLTVGGVVGILLSTPAVFVLAGVGITLIAHPAIGRTRAGWVRLVGTGSVWVILFALGYFMIYQGTANSDYMQSIWSGSFLSLPLQHAGGGRQRGNAHDVDRNDVRRERRHAAAKGHRERDRARSRWRDRSAAAARPAGRVARRAALRRDSGGVVRPSLAADTAPAGLSRAGARAAARRWSLGPGEFASRQGTRLALGVIGALYLVPASVYDARALRTPKRRDDVAPLVRDFMATRKEPAVMYVMGHGTPSWLFYTARWRERDGEAFRFAAERANTATHFQTRGCITQEPGLRVAFGPTGSDVLTDSALAGEAAWLAAQPEREVWLLTLSYEHAAGHVMERKLIDQGATRVDERSRQGAELRHFRFGAPPRTGTTVSCETQLVAPE